MSLLSARRRRAARDHGLVALPPALALACALVTAPAPAAEHGGAEASVEAPMTVARLESILKEVDPEASGGQGRWRLMQDGIPVLVLTSEAHNRMRVIAPVAEVEKLDREALIRMMRANFSSALDVRYAVFEGVVWAAFLHPLDSLRARDLRSALDQVATLVKTTGTTYSSSGLRFGPGYEGKEEEEGGEKGGKEGGEGGAPKNPTD